MTAKERDRVAALVAQAYREGWVDAKEEETQARKLGDGYTPLKVDEAYAYTEVQPELLAFLQERTR